MQLSLFSLFTLLAAAQSARAYYCCIHGSPTGLCPLVGVEARAPEPAYAPREPLLPPRVCCCSADTQEQCSPHCNVSLDYVHSCGCPQSAERMMCRYDDVRNMKKMELTAQSVCSLLNEI